MSLMLWFRLVESLRLVGRYTFGDTKHPIDLIYDARLNELASRQESDVIWRSISDGLLPMQTRREVVEPRSKDDEASPEEMTKAMQKLHKAELEACRAECAAALDAKDKALEVALEAKDEAHKADLRVREARKVNFQDTMLKELMFLLEYNDQAMKVLRDCRDENFRRSVQAKKLRENIPLAISEWKRRTGTVWKSSNWNAERD
ncbi:hypothetical protein P171DRAFT_432432 [Karstenula rhodostoma CBS 690.94]|uniref:Uncharacterized protein n=1 Tax=Karstenula rhodostoma CBS 690.94 TaxID=1392251 RepID=A0A9P4UCI1_9PLEO|nr:hypothetical protein P171DRAFT_432432 [Karstenula rhodostoma CBS 690.94]